MSKRLQDDEALEAAPLSSDPLESRPKKRSGQAWILVSLLILWSGAVYWFFTREETKGEKPPEGVETAQPSPVPSPQSSPEVTPTPETPEPTPTATPQPVVRILSNPSGATVVVDGEFKGTTPLDLEGADTGQGVLIRKRGYESVLTRIPEDGIPGELTMELVPETGVIQVQLSPPGSRLWIDGNSVDLPENGQVVLTMTSHTLRAEAPGHLPAEIEVTPAETYMREVKLRLSPIPTPTPVLAPGEESPETPASRTNSIGITLVRPELPLKGSIGSPRGTAARQANEVQRRVALTRPFRLSETEITNAQFRKFRPEHDSGQWKGRSLNGANLPVVNVTWSDAVEFANWLSRQEGLPPAYVKEGDTWRFDPGPGTGYRLPTEAEWEMVARSASTGPYSWGDAFRPPAGKVNIAGEESRPGVLTVLKGYRDPYPGPAPADNAWKGPLPVKGLAGNVREWVHDGYEIPGGTAEETNPMGDAGKRFHVIKGAGWKSAGVVDLRVARRAYAESAAPDVGFRLARYVSVDADR